MSEVLAARAQDIPEGAHRVVTVRGREIGLFNVRGRYYALPNNCFHQNGPVCLGVVTGAVIARAETGWRKEYTQDGEIVVCPWHALEFNVTTGQCLAFPKRRLPVYPVRVVDDELWIDLEGAGQSAEPDGAR